LSRPPSPAPWSFSRVKAFDTCPKQFYHVQVLREFPFQETEATRYGTEFHKAAEEFIRDDAPIPPAFEFARPALEVLKNRPGQKLCEQKLGLTDRLEPCDFFDRNVWFRGVVDLAIIEGDRAWIVDYKTGKSARYAERGQLELMALAIFRHFPEIKQIKAGLLFVIANDFVKADYARSGARELWEKWLAEYGKMAKAFETNVWNPKPSGLCKRHCPVQECPHHGGN